MVKNERNKGITLIALIVTIVVLLILAGVTINAINGSESAMEKATEAREKNIQGAELEQIKLCVVNAMAQGLDGKVSETNLKTALNGIVAQSEINKITGAGPWTIQGNSGKKYRITNSGLVDILDVITSGFDFKWQAATLDSSNGVINTNVLSGYPLNNYLSDIFYFDKIKINISDNILIKIAYYDANGNFISAEPWKSKSQTNWSNGGIEKIAIEDSYIRICIADTTVNSTGAYTLTSEEIASRFSYEIYKNKLEENVEVISSGFYFNWKTATLDSSNGNINYSASSGATLNNYLSDVFHFEKIKLNISDNLLIKIAYYDKNDNFISADPWKSKNQTNWSSGGTEQIIIEDSYIRICIADTTVNSTGAYTLTDEQLSSRFTYEIYGSEYEQKSKIVLPDVEKGETGKGFTCTGLTYDETDKCFYVGNYGKMLPSDSTIYNTIVKLSADGNTVLGEIKLYDTIPTMTGDIQGLTVDYSDNTIWVVAYAEGKIYHINKSGTLLGTVNHTGANGIAYDNRTDTLWVLAITNNGGNIKNITKSGETNKTITFTGISAVDQMYLDTQSNTIYFSAGANYNSNNYIYKANLNTDEISLYKTLEDSYAIEGIWIKDNLLYVMNDGYYHSAKYRYNYMMIYSL